MTVPYAHLPHMIEAVRILTEDGASARGTARAIGITTRTVQRIRETNNIHPPAAFLDDIAIEQACDGHRMTLTPLETREAVRILTGRGLGARQIATRLGVTERTVVRHRARLAQGVPA